MIAVLFFQFILQHRAQKKTYRVIWNGSSIDVCVENDKNILTWKLVRCIGYLPISTYRKPYINLGKRIEEAI